MATASVSSMAALDTLLTSWATGGGDTVTEASVVTIEDGDYGGLNVSGLSFPHRVWVQGRAPSSDGASPVRVTTGLWNVTGTTNLGIRLIEFRDGDERITPDNSTNLWIDRCKLLGTDAANPAAGAYPDTYLLNPLDGGDQSGFKVTNCLLGQIASVAIRVREGSGQEISGNLFIDSSADFIRLSEPSTGCAIEDNWFGKRMNPGTGSHCDAVQATVDCVYTGPIRGNVIWRGAMQRDPAISLQGIFIGDGGSVTGDVSDNIIVNDSGHGISLFTSLGSTVDNNLVCIVAEETGNQPSITIDELDTATRNFVCSTGTNADLDGTNLVVSPGSPPDTSDIEPYYAAHPTLLGNIGQLTPVEESGNHWDDTNPYGPAARLKEIIVDGLHPGNVGWPVAEEWTNLYNNPAQSGTVIASTYSGSYNADGTNTGAAPPATGPSLLITCTTS